MRRERAGRILLFAGLYGLAQFAYQGLRDSLLGTWLVEQATVAPAAALIALLFPTDAVQPLGPRLVWPGGRLQLLAGCDGFEVVALLVPAVLAAPVPWRRRLFMLTVGIALIWGLNQLRLLALYASFRHWRDAFDPLHTVWGPLLMLVLVSAFFAWNLRDARST